MYSYFNTLGLTCPAAVVRFKARGAASPNSCRHFSTQVTLSLSHLTASISDMATQLSFSQQLNSAFLFFFLFLFYFPLYFAIYNAKCNKASIPCKQ